MSAPTQHPTRARVAFLLGACAYTQAAGGRPQCYNPTARHALTGGSA